MNGLRLLITAALAATLMACEETPETTTHDSINDSGFYANFSPSDKVVPFPNNLLFLGSADATLNIDPTGLTGGELGLVTAMNSMDGFSTVAPMSTTFSSAIDSASLIAGSTVRVFEVTLSGVGGAVTGVTAELTAADFVATISSVDGSDVNAPDIGANKLVITPLKPLKPATSYAVVLTDQIKDTNGDKALASLIYSFSKNETPLINTTPPTSLAHVNYPGLLLTADTDLNGSIDGVEAAAALASIESLEGLRQLTKISEDQVVANADPVITKPEIVLSWVFSTQTTALSTHHIIGSAHALKHAKTQVPANPAHNINSSLTMTTTAIGGQGYADIHVGTLDVPYYLQDNSVNPAGPGIGYWKNSGGTFSTPLNPAPVLPAAPAEVLNATQTIPMILSVPNATAPACQAAGSLANCKDVGWPVVIFQHGITANRTSVLAIADNLAARGFAAIAIDLPLHGILTGAGDALSFRANTLAFDANAQERLFDVDYVNNTTGLSPGGDGTDTSGANFVNLPNMMTTRDNMNQAIADLFVLAKSLTVTTGTGTGMDYTGDGNGDFNSSKVYFIGHSLGGIVGASFLAIEAADADGVDIQDAVLAMPGGGIAKLLDGSASFGPVIENGLGASGVNKGTAEYEAFLASAQMMIDAGDPVNYATTLGDAAYTQGLLMFEVVGDGALNLSDLVVPNAVPDSNDVASTVPAPLSGTDPLISLMGLVQYNADSTEGTNRKAIVKYTAGDHSSLLSPVASAAVFAEMQTQAADFLLNDGVLNVTDDTVLEVPATP